MKKLALVLGGGAAKGFAHIGVLKVLEKNGIKPDLIVGTSMGALVGGIYSTGVTAHELEQVAIKLNGIGRFSLYSTLFKDSVMSIKKVKKIIDKYIGEKTHQECKIKFVAVATELTKGREHHFSNGKLKDSIMASISVPGVFPRIIIGDEMYCDGGIFNNLPEDVAKKIMPEAFVLSVDVIGPYDKQVEHLKMKTIETALNATTILTSNVVKNKPKMADLRLTLSMPEISQMDFKKDKAIKAVRYGEIMAENHLKEIKKKLGD